MTPFFPSKMPISMPLLLMLVQFKIEDFTTQ